MTPAFSKIDSSKFYNCEKSVNLKTFLLYVGYNMAKAQEPNMNNGLDTSNGNDIEMKQMKASIMGFSSILKGREHV